MKLPVKDVVLVTCVAWPTLSASDRKLADELTALGHRVRTCPWNASPLTDFTKSDIVVLRSNWDYHHDLDAFVAWLDQVDRSDAELHNSAALVRSLLDKSYLTELQAAGLRTPKTIVTSDFNLDVVLRWIEDHNLDKVVIKPAWGASGHGVELARPDDLPMVAERWNDDPTRRPMLIQEFLPQIDNGEIALVHFAGVFSHALLRKPAPGDFRVNGGYGGSISPLDNIDSDLVDFAAKVEAALPERATYARIDVVSDGVDHIVMEVEVNEPALGLDLVPGSAARFAAALVS